MDEDQVILTLVDEIEALKRQQEANLADYSAKVSVLDKEVKGLTEKKAFLVKEVAGLGNEIDSLVAAIEKTKKDKAVILSDALNEAKEIVNSANETATNLIADANNINQKAKEALALVNGKEDSANNAQKVAEETLTNAKMVRIAAKADLEAALKQIEVARRDTAEAKALISIAEDKKKAADTAMFFAEAKEIDNKSMSTKIAEARQALTDEKAEFEQTKAKFAAEIIVKEQDLVKKQEEVAMLRDQLIKQKDANAFKIAELEAGFSKLKRENDNIKKQKGVIDNMKKELTK